MTFHFFENFYAKIVNMKGQSVGNVGEVLLWPNSVAMQALERLARPRNTLLLAEVAPDDLLWPAELINRQAQARSNRSFAVPVALVSFIVSAILGFVVGPMQLILLATTTYDYNWITTIYFASALKIVLLISSFVALFDLLALFWAWQAQPTRARLATTLICASLAEVGLIWIFSAAQDLPPHHLSLILLAGSVAGLVIALLIRKQYSHNNANGLAMKIFLGVLATLSCAELIGGIVYFAQASARPDSAEIQRITAEQAAAQLPGVNFSLSNSVYTLCDGRYQLIYLTSEQNSGLFECSNNGEVYSVMEIPSQNPKTIDTAATYLGTTKSSTITMAFPSAHYLYRSMPDALSSDELVLMVQANTERELVDNIVQPILNYWQTHNQHNLFLNVFYTRNIESISTTRDFILMAALDTMSLVEKLPHGNTIKGYANGEATNYLYVADTELKSLHELSIKPDLISADSLDALTFRRHLSLRLAANETLDYETLYERLNKSFVGGAS